MIPRAIFICLMLLPLTLAAQTSPWLAWDADLVRSLNSGAESEYLNEEEKKVILFINLARQNGPLFAETFLLSYIQEKNLENSSYIRSLQRDLKNISGLDPLLPEKDLTAVAQDHARKSGEKGTTGHGEFEKRFKPLLGKPYVQVAENCSYGYEKAVDIVISLLIDEGIKSLGHRKNILSKEFNSVGVAIRPHSKYRINCVIDFGSRDRSSLNEVPY